MAKNNLTIKEADEQVRSAERALTEARLRRRRKCFHNQVSNAHLIPIPETRLPEREKQKYTESTCMCDNCGDIFEVTGYSEREINDAFFAIHSMLAQMQLMNGAKFDDKEKAELEAAFDKLDYLETLIGNFYVEMIKNMTKGNNKGGKKKTSKGGIGISSGMMR